MGEITALEFEVGSFAAGQLKYDADCGSCHAAGSHDTTIQFRAGDLYVVVDVQQHPVFERHGDDLYTAKEIDVAQATLGAEIPVPSLDGVATLAITEGTQTGSLFRVEGKGMPRLGSRNKGDLYVMVQLVTPRDISEEQRNLLARFQFLEQEKNIQ